MVKTTRNKHNGVKYVKFTHSKKINGVLTKSDGKKYQLNGHPVICCTKGSYKYGEEVQINVIAPGGTSINVARVAYAGTWDTIEVPMPPQVFKEMVKEYVAWLKMGGWDYEETRNTNAWL